MISYKFEPDSAAVGDGSGSQLRCPIASRWCEPDDSPLHRDTCVRQLSKLNQWLMPDTLLVMAVTAALTLTCEPHSKMSTAGTFGKLDRKERQMSIRLIGGSVAIALVALLSSAAPSRAYIPQPWCSDSIETAAGAPVCMYSSYHQLRRAAAAWPTRGSNRSRRYQVRLPSCYRSRCTTHTIRFLMSLNLLREVDLEDPADAKAMVGSFFVGRRHHGGHRRESKSLPPKKHPASRRATEATRR
jgi:hypothetical protein